MAVVRCPGCNNDMTRGSTLCRRCRRRAIDLGVRAVLEGAQGPRPRPKITSGQIRGFYGKATTLNGLQGLDRDDPATHDEMLMWATQLLGRDITSVKDLYEDEANDVLTHMSTRIIDLKRAGAAP